MNCLTWRSSGGHYEFSCFSIQKPRMIIRIFKSIRLRGPLKIIFLLLRLLVEDLKDKTSYLHIPISPVFISFPSVVLKASALPRQSFLSFAKLLTCSQEAQPALSFSFFYGSPPIRFIMTWLPASLSSSDERYNRMIPLHQSSSIQF